MRCCGLGLFATGPVGCISLGVILPDQPPLSPILGGWKETQRGFAPLRAPCVERTIVGRVERSETRRQSECQVRNLTWVPIEMEASFNPLAPILGGVEKEAEGHPQTPAAFRCTIEPVTGRISMRPGRLISCRRHAWRPGSRRSCSLTGTRRWCRRTRGTAGPWCCWCHRDRE